MSDLRKSLLDDEFRPLCRMDIYRVRWADKGKRSVEVQIKGYTTDPISDDMIETRQYGFPTPECAMRAGALIVKEAINCKIKDLFKKK